MVDYFAWTDALSAPPERAAADSEPVPSGQRRVLPHRPVLRRRPQPRPRP